MLWLRGRHCLSHQAWSRTNNYIECQEFGTDWQLFKKLVPATKKKLKLWCDLIKIRHPPIQVSRSYRNEKLFYVHCHRAAADFIRFVKLLIKMYQTRNTPKIPNGFVCSRQCSVSINFLKWADGRRNGDQIQCSVFRSSRPSASGPHSLPTTQCRRPC